MNTIRKTRRRPRESSVNFRAFFWLLRMEVIRSLLYLPCHDADHEQRIRAAICNLDGRYLMPRAYRALGLTCPNGRR